MEMKKKKKKKPYDLGFSFFSLNKANKDTLATLTTLNLTPGKSPTE